MFPFAFFSGAPGAGELVVVFLVVLILFGPKRLPEIVRTIGKALAQLRRASHDFRDQIMRIDDLDVYDIPPDQDELSDPESDVMDGAAPEEDVADADDNQEKA